MGGRITRRGLNLEEGKLCCLVKLCLWLESYSSLYLIQQGWKGVEGLAYLGLERGRGTSFFWIGRLGRISWVGTGRVLWVGRLASYPSPDLACPT